MSSSGATPETVKKAFELLLSNPGVTSIFLNVFGGEYPLSLHFLSAPSAGLWIQYELMFLHFGSEGIMRCDYIAEGVINAAKELNMNIPLVVRLKGTKEDEAKQYVLAL